MEKVKTNGHHGVKIKPIDSSFQRNDDARSQSKNSTASISKISFSRNKALKSQKLPAKRLFGNLVEPLV